VYAFLTDSVDARIKVPGPAAASNPFAEEMLSSDAVEGGSRSLGHDCGRRRSLVSPAIARKPRFYFSQSMFAITRVFRLPLSESLQDLDLQQSAQHFQFAAQRLQSSKTWLPEARIGCWEENVREPAG